MTTADPQHVRAGGVGRVWRGFRRWRRTRPFWGGLFTALAGVEMFASTRMTLNGLSFHSGSTGLYSLLIPVILLTCGLLLWFSPAQRLFYAIVAAVTTIYSLMGLNLGGFFLGLLLGMVGSALGFAWAPTARPAPAEGDGPDGRVAGTPPATTGSDDPGLVDELMPADSRGVPRQRDAATARSGDGAPAAGPDDPPEPSGGSRDPRYFAVALLVLGLSAAGLVAIQPQPVRAAPPSPAATACPKPPGKVSTPSPSAGRALPTSTPTASPSPSPGATSDGNILTDILGGIGDLFTGGPQAEPSPTPSASATPTPSAGAAGPAAAPTPTATGSGSDCPAGKPAKPAKPGTAQPGRLMPKIAPEPGQPKVARQPSKLTGSKVTMTGLRFEGIVDLPTSDGTLKALKFSMAKAVTDDFKLVADGPAGRNQQYVTDRLTVQGDVAFYATRFVGRLLGIKITLTPDLPFPDGIPVTSPIPITFTDPVVDLAFVDCDTLTARPALALSLS
ncbi:hypothetical protein EV384_0575 [Micromonospora kangleipakensis]|uniref:Uncharacterized protein n=1 Tax=Micromonospora kangleipakensis TaxID=1077942 RepID=A0A4V2GCJ1_9ACTN|nr:DUF6114 domain-containing protein [Micromonospora kangleipakensis]RZU72226.1 hypothetical protein EV384_0575 [Micromonospora kangleipakensis]